MDDNQVLESYRRMMYERDDREYVALIPPNELLPNARAMYDQAIRELGVASIPVLVDMNRDVGDDSVTVASIRSGDSAPQSPYLVISEYSHRWSADYVRRVSPTNAEIDAKYDRITDRILLRQNEEISAKLGVSPPPTLYYSKDPEAHKNFADISQQGLLYIVLDPTASLEEQMAVLPHEIGHHALGQTSFEGFAAVHNAQSYEARRELERAADRKAAQVCGGIELADVLQMHREQKIKRLEAKGEVFDARDPNQNSPSHPPTEERVADLRAQAKALVEAGLCPESHARVKDALPGMKQVRGGADVAQNDAPNVSGDRAQQQGLAGIPPR